MVDEKLVNAVLEDWALAYEEWLSTGVSLLIDPSYEFALIESRDVMQRLTTAFEGVAAEDVRIFVSGLLFGLQHSMLTVIDGAAASAEVGSIGLVDQGGEKFPAGLHELYTAYLMNSGRIK